MLSFLLRPSWKTETETKTASARRQKGSQARATNKKVSTYLTFYMKDGSQGKYGYLPFPHVYTASSGIHTPYTHATALISSTAFWAMQQNEEQRLASSVLSTSVNGGNNNTTYAAVSVHKF